MSVWGSDIAVEVIGGVPYRMYSERPRRVIEVLRLGERWGPRPAVVQGERSLTFDGLRAAAARKARLLREAGVQPRDHVLVFGWNSPEWVVNFWACQWLGAVPALANAWWGESELRDAIELLRPALALADERCAARVPAGCPLGPWALDTSPGPIDEVPAAGGDENDAAEIVFTSGSSGRAKAVELSQRATLANVQMMLAMTRRLPQQVDDESGEVVLHTGPLFHVGGPQMLMRSVAVGNTIVLPAGRFDPADVLELIERHQITRWSAVPTMVTRVIDHPDLRARDVTSLRALTIGGAPIHPELLERIGRDLPGVTAGVPTGYGLTENCGQGTAASGRDTLRHPGSAGRPFPLVELGFLEHDGLPDAEVLLRSPTQMTRYLGDEPSPIDADGWLHTGDLGRVDDDGRLWITGRAKDLIIRGGENISPAAVERAIASIGGVSEVAVVGVPHPDLGEEVYAYVVTDGGVTREQLVDSLRGQIASFAVPTLWHLQREALPTNQTGKIDKAALASRARDERSALTSHSSKG